MSASLCHGNCLATVIVMPTQLLCLLLQVVQVVRALYVPATKITFLS